MVIGAKLHETILAYFEKVFSSSGCQLDNMHGLIFPQITQEQNAKLLKPFSREEVKAALFNMNPDKAPGPDGMNPKFF